MALGFDHRQDPHLERAPRKAPAAQARGGPEGIARWRAVRSFRAGQFPLERLLEAKRSSVAVILPAREVAPTIADVATRVMRLREAGLIDEAIVVDAHSQDGTAELARATGIGVLQQDDLAPELGPAQGKGDAMWRALGAISSEIVAFLDADTAHFHAGFVTGLLGPLICEPGVDFVKGRFERSLRDGSRLLSGEGGRVTELMARPLLNLYAPELALFDQPLAGEVAARRELLERIPFCVGYGVEIGMLIDAWRLAGLERLAQVDLGERQQHSHQPLRELSAMAYAVLAAASTRLLAEGLTGADQTGEGLSGEGLSGERESGSMLMPPRVAGGSVELREIPVGERPPLVRSAVMRAPPTGSMQAPPTASTQAPRSASMQAV